MERTYPVAPPKLRVYFTILDSEVVLHRGSYPSYDKTSRQACQERFYECLSQGLTVLLNTKPRSTK